jgi:hypothetical protein
MVKRVDKNEKPINIVVEMKEIKERRMKNMRMVEDLKNSFNIDCATAMDCLKVWDVTPFLKGSSSGQQFSNSVQHYLLISPEKSYSMNGKERKKLVKVYRKYRKLVRLLRN